MTLSRAYATCRHLARRFVAIEMLMALLCTYPLNGDSTTTIRFENRQKQSGVNFILDNGTIPDKPIVDSVLGGVALTASLTSISQMGPNSHRWKSAARNIAIDCTATGTIGPSRT